VPATSKIRGRIDCTHRLAKSAAYGYREVFADFADTSFLLAIIVGDAGATLWC
jgi:hypothetical protein